MNHKLVLGTAQFGLNYGINNNRGKIPKNEISEILRFASSEGIQMLDTAYGYGDSECRIGDALQEIKKKFQIVSKLPKCEKDEVFKICKESLNRLKMPCFYGYLMHNVDNIDNNFLQIWDEMLKLRERGKVKKIGISIYSPQKLELLFDKKIQFDIVQLPYSVLDQRFDAYFHKLNRSNVKIHVRSIFLQGLIYKKSNELTGNLRAIAEKLEILKSISMQRNISLSLLAIGFVSLNEKINKIVIGIDSLENLKENIMQLEKISSVRDVYNDIALLREDNEDIILPINWKN